MQTLARSISRRLLACAGLPALLGRLLWALVRMPGSGKAGGERVQDALNAVFAHAEHNGFMPRLPAFDRELLDYPELRALSAAYPVIRRECCLALEYRAALPDMQRLGGAYTDTPLNRIDWKVLMLKSGGAPIAQNCALCPETGALLAALPSAFNAFFSVLEAGQRIAPHFGYYKGFLRYHLGVVIPHDNVGGACFMRVHAEPGDDARRDPSVIERGQRYEWHEGEAVMFDDTCLHDAENGSDQVRVVLFIDVLRKLPRPLALFNRLALAAAYRLEPALREMPAIAAVQR